MEFKPLPRFGSNVAPRLAAKAKVATLTLPEQLLEKCGLEAGKVSVLTAVDGRQTYIRIESTKDGDYRLVSRGKSLVLSSLELRPTRPTADQEKGVNLDVHSTDDGLTLRLPRDWQLPKVA